MATRRHSWRSLPAPPPLKLVRSYSLMEVVQFLGYQGTPRSDMLDIDALVAILSEKTTRDFQLGVMETEAEVAEGTSMRLLNMHHIGSNETLFCRVVLTLAARAAATAWLETAERCPQAPATTAAVVRSQPASMICFKVATGVELSLD